MKTMWKIWSWLKSTFWRKGAARTCKTWRTLPAAAVDSIEHFRMSLIEYSEKQHVPWFGRQILRYIDEHGDSVTFEEGILKIDVSVTAIEPGDWGDEMFDTMYRLEENLKWRGDRRMTTVPSDFDKPEELRAKEHFGAVHWVVAKKLK